MAAPAVVNGDFSTPTVASASVTNPSGAGVGWTWDNGIASNSARIYAPGGNGWAGQSAGLIANNASGIESAAYQDVEFDGAAYRLRFWAKKVSGGAAVMVTLGGVTVVPQQSVPTSWTEFDVAVAPAAGMHRLRISNRDNWGSTLGIAAVSIASGTAPGRYICVEPGIFGLIG